MWRRHVALLGLLALAAASGLHPIAADSLNGELGFGELDEEWRGEIEQLSWKPRAYLMRHFLSEEEIAHIISIAEPKLAVSAVVDSQTGKWKNSTVRTSWGAMFQRGHDEVVRRVEKRVAQVSMIPVEHQEGMQVLRYQNGQKYEVHFDAFYDDYNQRKEAGGQRVVTVLMYLAAPEEGGETVFPFADKKVSGPGWSECALQGLAHKPQKGDALMFYSLTPDGTKDPASQHGSCPTTKGTKFVATKWLHVLPFAVNKPARVCDDQHENCKEWAFFDECEKNPGYMLVSCKRACGKCGADRDKLVDDALLQVPLNLEEAVPVAVKVRKAVADT